MTLPESYINNVGSLSKFLEAIRSAGVPERVTFEFLKTLGFSSSNDRPIITIMKGIGFLDQNGAPTELYKAFRDPHQGPKVLAHALRTAYADLFLANTRAQDLPMDKLGGIIATKTSKSDTVTKLIAGTFKTLARAADFSESTTESKPHEVAAAKINGAVHDGATQQITREDSGPHVVGTALHYNIQVHLPTTTDITVYNAIFKSMKEHLF
jgi:hypothetical protein